MATLVFTLTGFDCITIIFFDLVRFYLETHKTVNTDQKYLWNVIVLKEINQLREITKLQTAMVISLWFWGLLAYPKLYCDWPVHNQHSWNFSGVQGFMSLTSSWLASSGLGFSVLDQMTCKVSCKQLRTNHFHWHVPQICNFLKQKKVFTWEKSSIPIMIG